MKHCLFVSPSSTDQQIFLRAFKHMAPYDCCILAKNSVEAFRVMKEKFALPDLICVERDMQSMNGLEFLRLCKENDRLKNVPVIVHAASLTKLEVDELRSSGALAVFTRPYDFYSVCTMLGIYFGIEPISISQN